jgi:GT2 family glycosyltransferase
MKLSVIIPCRNEVQYIEECIEAIFKNILPSDFEMSVILVDGMSNDGTRDIIKEAIKVHPNLYLCDNNDKLTPYAFNLGINYLKADYYQIIGARHIVSKNYFLKSIEILQNDFSIWCVGGRLINEFTNESSRIISKAMDTSFGMGLGNFRILDKSDFTDTVTSPMYPSWVFKKIGYFDEELIRNQDDDFNFRVSQAGGKIWFEYDISLRYYVRGNFKGLYKQFFQYGYWKVYVNKKHGEVTTLRQLVPPLFVLYLFILPFVLLMNLMLGAIFSSGLIFYILLSFVFALKKSIGIKEFFGIFKTFPILHFSYGLGYLQGLIHFIILGKKPSDKQKSLSR